MRAKKNLRMLEEAYKKVMVEAKEAPPGKHYKKGSDRLYKNGHTSDGDPDGGSRLNSDPTYKNPNESQEQEDLSKMHKFGNIQFMHLGKDRNGAEAFRVFKDGSYVLYATMYGPRDTVTLYADPEADGQPVAGPEEGRALKEFDKKQVPGGIEQVAAKLGASENAEDAEFGSEAEAYRDMSDKYRGEDSIEVGNIYKGESYHELVIGIKGDEVFTKKITLEDGNRYDKSQMLDEVKLAGKLDYDFLNEIM